jgi:hypothetical protein
MGTCTYPLYASDVPDARSATLLPWPAGDYAATGGDYWHVRVPWNSSAARNDAPNGRPNASGVIGAFQVQITAWCTACHSRYYSVDAGDPSGDALFAYRHETVANRACTTCHVAHGSNARMEGALSTMPFPDGSAPLYAIGGSTGDSRLLKVDNRGTCQLCHDPTYTVLVDTYTGPTPTPGVPCANAGAMTRRPSDRRSPGPAQEPDAAHERPPRSPRRSDVRSRSAGADDVARVHPDRPVGRSGRPDAGTER